MSKTKPTSFEVGLMIIFGYLNSIDQLPLLPPVLIGFLETVADFPPGFDMNFELWLLFFWLLFASFPSFLLFVGNDIMVFFG